MCLLFAMYKVVERLQGNNEGDLAEVQDTLHHAFSVRSDFCCYLRSSRGTTRTTFSVYAL